MKLYSQFRQLLLFCFSGRAPAALAGPSARPGPWRAWWPRPQGGWWTSALRTSSTAPPSTGTMAAMAVTWTEPSNTLQITVALTQKPPTPTSDGWVNSSGVLYLNFFKLTGGFSGANAQTYTWNKQSGWRFGPNKCVFEKLRWRETLPPGKQPVGATVA